MIDYHVHIGQFHNCYYDALELFSIIESCSEITGINQIFYSTTSTCRNDVELEKIEEEIAYAESFESEILKIQPYFWAIPKYGEQRVSIEKSMKSFNYCGFKLHPGGQFWDFSNDLHRKFLEDLFEYAEKYEKYILIHTGDNTTCKPNFFEDYIKNTSKAKIILAHSNPLEETIQMLEKYENVYCDTAFVSYENIKKIKINIKEDRILFGTDFPITAFFNDSLTKEQLKNDYIKNCDLLKELER